MFGRIFARNSCCLGFLTAGSQVQGGGKNSVFSWMICWNSKFWITFLNEKFSKILKFEMLEPHLSCITIISKFLRRKCWNFEFWNFNLGQTNKAFNLSTHIKVLKKKTQKRPRGFCYGLMLKNKTKSMYFYNSLFASYNPLFSTPQ